MSELVGTFGYTIQLNCILSTFSESVNWFETSKDEIIGAMVAKFMMYFYIYTCFYSRCLLIYIVRI